jgi:glucosamine-6-phosphate isomerase
MISSIFWKLIKPDKNVIMEVSVYKNLETLSDAVANQLVNLVRQKPAAVICMASGESPRMTCRLFVEKVKANNLDMSKFCFIGLDEWVGIPPDNPGSCHYFFKTELFDHLTIPKENIYLLDGMATDLDAECRKMDEVIFQKGRIDLMIVGIGMNGHIGFNEPYISFDNYAHVAALDETTISVGQKYFQVATELQQGITLGLRHLQEAKKVLLIANGAKKAEVIQQAVNGKVDPSFPASIMQTHSNGFIMVDQEAAGQLSADGNYILS